MASGFWDKELVITEVANEKSMTRVVLVEKDKKQFVDVRKFVKAKGAEEGTFTQHTSSGISIPIEHVDATAKALALAAEVIAKGGFDIGKKPSKGKKGKKSA